MRDRNTYRQCHTYREKYNTVATQPAIRSTNTGIHTNTQNNTGQINKPDKKAHTYILSNIQTGQPDRHTNRQAYRETYIHTYRPRSQTYNTLQSVIHTDKHTYIYTRNTIWQTGRTYARTYIQANKAYIHTIHTIQDNAYIHTYNTYRKTETYNAYIHTITTLHTHRHTRHTRQTNT